MNKIKLLVLSIIFITVGLIHVYPDIRFISELGHNFKGIHLMGASDESVYLSRITGVIYRNDLRLANAGVYGHQDDPIFQPSMGEVVEGLIGKALGLNAWQVDILATFLFPVLLCFLIYLLVKGLSSSFKTGILAALAVTLGYYWITPNLKAIFSLSPVYFNQPLFFLRPISPQFHFIPFILTLYFISKVCIEKDYVFVVPSGILAGLLFYTSIYYWTFIYAGLFALMIIELFRERLDNAKNFLFIYFISFIVGIPYLLSAAALNNLPYFSEIFLRGGGLYTHQRILPIMEIITLFFLVIMRFVFKEKKEYLYYMISFVTGGLICLNQQIITGKTVEPMHWQSYTNKVFIIICLFICASFVSRIKRVKSFNFALLFYPACFLFLALGVIQQNFYYSARSGVFRDLQAMGGILKYIHKEIPADSVILTDPFNLEEERMISVFTKNYPYISDSFFITSAMQDQEVEERYLFALHFFGYTALEAEKLFKYMNGGLLKGMQVHPRYGGTAEKNNAYINALKQRYLELTGQDPVSLLRRYKVDYVMLNAQGQERILGKNKIAKILNLRYTNGLYALFKLEKYE